MIDENLVRIGQQIGHIIENSEKMRADKCFRSVSQLFRNIDFEVNIFGRTFLDIMHFLDFVDFRTLDSPSYLNSFKETSKSFQQCHLCKFQFLRSCKIENVCPHILETLPSQNFQVLKT